MSVQPAPGAAPLRGSRKPTTAERAEECAAIQARLKQEAAARRAAAVAPASAGRGGQGRARRA